MAAGRLTMHEFDERSTVALDALTIGQLAKLLDDLPPVEEGVPEPEGLTFVQTLVDARSNFAYASGWLAMSFVCPVLWGLTPLPHGALYWFWPLFVIAPWGAILLARTLTGTVRPPKRWYYGNKPFDWM